MPATAQQLIGQVFAYEGEINRAATVIDIAGELAIVRIETRRRRQPMTIRIIEADPTALAAMPSLGRLEPIQRVIPSAAHLATLPDTPKQATAKAARKAAAKPKPTPVRPGDVFAYAGDRSRPATVVSTWGNGKVMVRIQTKRADGTSQHQLSDEAITRMRAMPRLGTVQACPHGSAPACALHLADLVG